MSEARFRDAGPEDVPAVVTLLNASARDLTDRFGKGHWSLQVSERGVVSSLAHGRLRVGVDGGAVVTVLRLARKKPWAIDVAYFTPVKLPLYLTSMAVGVSHRGRGLGRRAMDDALEVARGWPANAIRLDAYDAPAGAGSFYAACGLRECGRVAYRGTPLIYYEGLIS